MFFFLYLSKRDYLLLKAAMTYLDTDKQTYADLSITETANNEQFLFSLFSKTETKEGKSLMMNWIMYPLSDLDMIRKRQEAVAWDASPKTKEIGMKLIEKELDNIPSEKVRRIAEEHLRDIENGQRDFRF